MICARLHCAGLGLCMALLVLCRAGLDLGSAEDVVGWGCDAQGLVSDWAGDGLERTEQGWAGAGQG